VFLTSSVEDLSRSRIASLISGGFAMFQGESEKRPTRCVRRCRPIDRPACAPAQALAQDIPLSILYEDSDLIVVDKPAGLVVHPAAGNPDGTLVNALLGHVNDIQASAASYVQALFHRLDKGTSGAMVCAKNDFAHDSLTKQFADRDVKKSISPSAWIAQSHLRPDRQTRRQASRPKKKMSVDSPHGRPSRTEYRFWRIATGSPLWSVASTRTHSSNPRSHAIHRLPASYG